MSRIEKIILIIIGILTVVCGTSFYLLVSNIEKFIWWLK